MMTRVGVQSAGGSPEKTDTFDGSVHGYPYEAEKPVTPRGEIWMWIIQALGRKKWPNRWYIRGSQVAF